MANVLIDQKECIGCKLCVSCSPDLFEFDDKRFKAKLKQKGKATEILSADLSSEQLTKIKEAIEICPTQAIKLAE